MNDRDTIAALFRYSDRANTLVIDAAKTLDDEKLDQRFEMGVGSLRRTLMHIWTGEFVWLQRWQGKSETRWPNELEPVAVSVIADRLATVWRERDAFLAGLSPEAMPKTQTYRDSKGSLYTATLHDMILQMFVHSTHHRAQAVNMLRHLGAALPGAGQLDYMMQVRKPA